MKHRTRRVVEYSILALFAVGFIWLGIESLSELLVNVSQNWRH